jgi:transposase
LARAGRLHACGILANAAHIKGVPGRKSDMNDATWIADLLAHGLIRASAWAAARRKNSYFQAQFLRLKARCGPKKAAIAVAASILTTAYHMLADGTCYQDLGADHFARRDPARAAAKLATRIRNLGFNVEIRPAA